MLVYFSFALKDISGDVQQVKHELEDIAGIEIGATDVKERDGATKNLEEVYVQLVL